MLGIIRKGKPNMAVLLYKFTFHPPEYSVKFWTLKKDREELEKVQRRVTGQAKVPSNFCTRNSAGPWGVSSWNRRDGEHCTEKAMKSLIIQREWIGIKC